VTVMTSPRNSAVLKIPRGESPWMVNVAAILGIVFAVLVFTTNGRKFRPGFVLATATVAAAIFLVSCSRGGTVQNLNAGTPAGTYTLTVSATSGGATRTENLTLIVN